MGLTAALLDTIENHPDITSTAVIKELSRNGYNASNIGKLTRDARIMLYRLRKAGKIISQSRPGRGKLKIMTYSIAQAGKQVADITHLLPEKLIPPIAG